MKKHVLKFMVLVGVAMLVANLVAEAAIIPYAVDAPSTMAPNTLASHEIKFVTPSGVNAASETIRINFGANGYALTDNTQDMQKYYRISTRSSDDCNATSGWTAKNLVRTSTNDKWGVEANIVDDYITFTAPTNATTGEIGANTCIWISAGGPNTNNGSAIITNPTPESAKPLTVDGTFGDTGSFNTLVVTAASEFSVSNVQLIVNTDHTMKIDDAAITYSLPPTAGELEFYFLPSSCADGNIASIKSALNTYPYCGDPAGFAILRPAEYYMYNNVTGWLVIGACDDANIDCGDNPSHFQIGFISKSEIKEGLKTGTTITLENSL